MYSSTDPPPQKGSRRRLRTLLPITTRKSPGSIPSRCTPVTFSAPLSIIISASSSLGQRRDGGVSARFVCRHISPRTHAQVGGLPTASSWRLLQPPPSSPPPELRSPSCWDRRVLRDPKRICVIPKESGRATRDAPRRGGHSGGRGGLPHSAGLCAWYWASASEPTVAVPCSTRARRLPKPSNPLSMMGVSAPVVFLGLLLLSFFVRDRTAYSKVTSPLPRFRVELPRTPDPADLHPNGVCRFSTTAVGVAKREWQATDPL